MNPLRLIYPTVLLIATLVALVAVSPIILLAFIVRFHEESHA